jgi:hypothetical protein
LGADTRCFVALVNRGSNLNFCAPWILLASLLLTLLRENDRF